MGIFIIAADEHIVQGEMKVQHFYLRSPLTIDDLVATFPSVPILSSRRLGGIDAVRRWDSHVHTAAGGICRILRGRFAERVRRQTSHPVATNDHGLLGILPL